DMSGSCFHRNDYWKRSIYSACAAREAAEMLKLANPDEMFLCGLLGDIGMLVLDTVLGKQYGLVFKEAENHEVLRVAEYDTLETTHAEAGAYLLESWDLPESIVVPIRRHCDPDEVEPGRHRQLAFTIALAQRCADVYMGDDPVNAIPDVRNRMNAIIADGGMPLTDDSSADLLLQRVGEQAADTADLFDLVVPKIPYEQVLVEANEALVHINIQAQQKANSLVQQAADLEFAFFEREEELKEKATTDALTGLKNRAEFDRFLRDAMEKSVRYDEPLAMVLIDLDEFKSVNDTYGHQAGDAVLRRVARLLHNMKRTGDLAARYGGEEMALVLPGTDRATAAAMAETFRRALQADSIDIGEKSLDITASFGVAAYEPPDDRLADVDKLVGTTDKALYFAKTNGRNRVKIFNPSSTVTQEAGHGATGFDNDKVSAAA
ncbi:MAG: diguanylate cyclase, partial [Planctomycetota bacterium]